MKLPPRYLGLVTRGQLAEMLAHGYAAAKNVDPNEAYQRLDTALRNLRLIERVQQAIWVAIIDKKPKLDDAQLIELLEKKLSGSKRFKAPKVKRAEQGALAALWVAVDVEAGFGGGDAADLLATPQGEQLLALGYQRVGEHLAEEMLR